MQISNLKNTDKYYWTEHAKFKMKFYGLSPQRVLRVIRNPERIEDGIVEKTTAVMQPASTRFVSSSKRGGPASAKIKNGKKTWSSEIWAMYQKKVKSSKLKVQSGIQNYQLKADPPLAEKFQKLKNNQLKIISAWRYPGVSPKNNPIPDDILREIEESK